MKIKRNPPDIKKRKKAKLYQSVVFDNYIRFKWPVKVESEIRSAFTMLNPDYLQLCKRRRLKVSERPKGYIVTKEKIDGKWTSRKIPQYLFYYHYDGSDLVVPRGAWKVVKSLFTKHKVIYKITDNRITHPKTNFTFHSKLLKERGQSAILKYTAKNGILQAGTGVGKTVLALYLACQFQQPFCVVVDTKELMNQWKKRITLHLKIEKENIGQIGSGIAKIKSVTVALMQTLREKPGLLDNFGFLIIDECHISAVDSYGKIINNYKGRYLLGVSATPRRKDGKTRVMLWYCGKIHLVISPNKVKKLPATGVFVNTGYEGELDFRKKYALAKVALLENEERNQLIINNIINRIDFYGIHLIISSSAKHLEQLYSMLPDHIQLISHLLIGKVKDSERKKIVEKAENNKLKFIFATDKIIEKGFDEERLSCLHIVFPVADPDKIEQMCGRVTRIPLNPEVKQKKKSALICYYFDSLEQTLRAAASQTSKRFRKLGIKKAIQ